VSGVGIEKKDVLNLCAENKIKEKSRGWTNKGTAALDSTASDRQTVPSDEDAHNLGFSA
jgi:hypothetical protein